MEQVPDDINREIFSYLITCGSQHRYIVNKFTRDYYNDNYKICAPVKALGRTICANCDSDAVKFLRYMKWGLY